ncbi:hypothetical protein [Bdellovibrio sp. NC01]|uniref:hypothetical protein n=1 Tax=Bdellovibrio sp. NC01 TaxID=2220073 RepID=UPI00115A85B3|nr:hypothetical protein [Bdellovibrio sp. NC01]QDK37730.1 hypothetical protein DOE51_09100 [Bdellovibrio sp. NC01]
MRRLRAEKFGMESSTILSVISIILFCACCRQFIKTVVTPIPLLASERPYARGAMQLGKFYKVIAWGSMTGVFLLGTSISFYQVFSSL